MGPARRCSLSVAIPAFVAAALMGCPMPVDPDGGVVMPLDAAPSVDAPRSEVGDDAGIDVGHADDDVGGVIDARALDASDDACSPRCPADGLTACTPDGDLLRCVAISATCALWAEVPCPAVLRCGEHSTGAACGGDCTDECDPVDFPECIDRAPAACANYDSDPCTELWRGELLCPTLGAASCASGRDLRHCELQANGCLDWTSTPCGPGEVCDPAGPRCVCADECPDEGAVTCASDSARQRCADHDGDGCLEWGNVTECGPGTTCESGVCSTSCTHQCSGIGHVLCYPGRRARGCGQYDTDACLEPGPEVTCPDGTHCDFGAVGGVACVGCRSSTDCAPDVAVCEAGACTAPAGTCYQAEPGALSVVVPAGAVIDDVGLFLGLSGLGSITARSFVMFLRAPDGSAAYIDACAGLSAGDVYRGVLDAGDAPGLADLSGGPRGGTWTLEVLPCASGGPTIDTWAVCLSP